MAVTKTVEETISIQDPVATTTTGNYTDSTLATSQDQELFAAKMTQLVYFIFGVIEVLLVLRIIFLLFAAGRTGFVNFIYNVTYPFVYPFKGIFPAPAAGGAYFDTSAFVAVIVVALIAWGLASLINLLLSRTR